VLSPAGPIATSPSVEDRSGCPITPNPARMPSPSASTGASTTEPSRFVMYPVTTSASSRGPADSSCVSGISASVDAKRKRDEPVGSFEPVVFVPAKDSRKNESRKHKPTVVGTCAPYSKKVVKPVPKDEYTDSDPSDVEIGNFEPVEERSIYDAFREAPDPKNAFSAHRKQRRAFYNMTLAEVPLVGPFLIDSFVVFERLR